MGIKLISFIVPVYNCGQYIKKCVDSIYKCGHRNIECILIDDGSADNSGIMCDQIREKFNSVTVIHTNNLGVSNARNIGLDYAKGEYISFVDADDYIFPVDFSFMDSSKDIYCLGMQKQTSTSISSIEFVDNGLEYDFIHYPVYMNSLCNKFFRRELFETNHIRLKSELFASEDLEIIVRLIGIGASIQFVNQAYYVYRDNVDSATHKSFTEQHVKNNYQAYLSIAEICSNSQNIPLTSQFLKYLRLKILIPYLTEKDFYNPNMFRGLTSKSDIWDFDFNRAWKILTWFAQKKIDVVPYCYMVIRHTLHRK